MRLEGKHWALIAGFLAGVGTQLATAQHGWSDVLTTGFVAGLLIQISTLIGAIFVGAPGDAAKVESGTSSGVDPKRFVGAAFVTLLLAGAMVATSACASAPPAGTYSETGLKTFNADQVMKDVQALSQTAINLNAETGARHLSDRDTAVVRDFALSAGAGLQAYANGSGTLAIVASAYHELIARLSADAKLNDSMRFTLALIDGALSNVR